MGASRGLHASKCLHRPAGRTRLADGMDARELLLDAALKVYADHAEHKAWERVYRKIRVPGTTTFDIIVE